MYSLVLTHVDLRTIRLKITDFIKNTVDAAAAKGATVAMSGGVDSSLVARLAHDVVDVKALILPELGVTPQEDIFHAIAIAETYGIPYKLVKINNIINCINTAKGLLELSGTENQKVIIANVKARARMILSYAVANAENRIVLGTGNRTELRVGYFTKYGDGGVDILPIGSLYKTHVYQLAAYLALPDYIIKKAPSAGLWVGQTDEEELGISYNDLDKILVGLDERRSVEQIARDLDINKSKVTEVYDRVLQSKHKLETPPIAKVWD
ncbi:MAG TPA: NAD+ synthase [Candidatus Acidoferrales bacterium]|nr:NAD+ synthase [Candidatus Acidoferrales bacterium]